MRRLSRSTDRDVTDGDDRQIKLPALQVVHIEQHIPDPDNNAVKPGKDKKFIVYFYKVAFHSPFSDSLYEIYFSNEKNIQIMYAKLQKKNDSAKLLTLF